MASLSNDPGGTRRILVIVDGKRRTIRLGDIPKRQAEGILREITALSSARIDGSAPPERTAKWLAGIDSKLRKRLVTAGLVAPTEPVAAKQAPTVAELAAQFEAQRFPRLKLNTQANYKRSFARFVAMVGADKLVSDVTPGDAEAFRDKLLNDGAAEATARRHCADACILMGYAVKHRIIDRNPFVDCGDAVPRKIRGTKHTADISNETFAKVLAVVESPELRLAFCLSRYGGLRVPSEIRGLRWSDVDWGRRRFRVLSPKTERYEGRAERMVPLFPELMKAFEALYLTREGDDDALVMPWVSQRPGNYVARQLVAAAERAKVTRWPRIMHNMRATRQTELEHDYPTHVVCAWLGNSPDVARETYLRVRDEDFDKAAQKVAQKAAQKAAQSLHATRRNTKKDTSTDEQAEAAKC
jgi:integrase